MLNLASVAANIQGNKVEIDTRLVARTVEQRKLLRPPWWVVGSAAFLFQVEDELCVALVQRTHDTSHPCRWALIPAGVADNIYELHHPSFIVGREAVEELRIFKDDNLISPFAVSDLLSTNQIEIYDRATDKTYYDAGDIYIYGKQVFFCMTLRVREDISNLILSDGEESFLRRSPLERMIALVSIDKLSGLVTPVKMYQYEQEIPVREIGLTSFETPTLEWFRGMARNLDV